MEPWISCIMITSFDDDKGPVIDYVYPKACLRPAVETEVRMLSLPRTNRNSEENYFYIIRIRVDDTRNYAECPLKEHDFMYGYVYFQWVFDKEMMVRRIEDPQHKRGFSQVSTVVLSRLPLYSLFRKC